MNQSKVPLPLQAVLNLCRDELFTGLVRATGEDSRFLDVVVSSGAVIHSYSYHGDGTPERADAAESESRLLAQAHLPARSIKLPAYALHLFKLFTESAAAGETRQVPTGDVVSLLPEWQSRQSPSLVSFRWQGADGLLYLPGSGSYARHSAFIAGSRVEQEIIPAIEMWDEPVCAINRYDPDMETRAWREYHVHLSFVTIANALMSRYEQFGGRPLINGLGNQLSEIIQAQGWNMSVVGAKVIDRQIFVDDRQALRAYRALLRMILANIEAMLGPARVESMIKTVFEQGEAFVLKYTVGEELIPAKWLPGGDK